jgi:hypothetical protein
MDESDTATRLDSAERMLLGTICASESLEVARHVAREIGDYRWHDRDHQIAFEALARIRRLDGRPLREQLAAETTRMGFPDIDWDEYFPAPARRTEVTGHRPDESLAALFDELKAAAALRK